MSSAVLSSANVHDLQALAGGSPWWANTVHHVITSPSHRTNDGEQVKVCLACFSGATWQTLPASALRPRRRRCQELKINQLHNLAV